MEALLLLGVLLLAALLPAAPALPTPRELARTVLEAHGQDAGTGLKLLKLQGVTRTKFDWGTHFTINLTARETACPKNPGEPRRAGCKARPGQVLHCVAQISVFAFLPDVPLSMVECGRQPVARGSPAPKVGAARGPRKPSASGTRHRPESP